MKAICQAKYDAEINKLVRERIKKITKGWSKHQDIIVGECMSNDDGFLAK